MTDKQPEALRLADLLENEKHVTDLALFKAAAELRRLHDENEVLRRCLFQMQEAAKGQGLTAITKATGEQQ
jgi:hypothetical protein